MWKFVGKLASWEEVYDREDGSHIHENVRHEWIFATLSETDSLDREIFWSEKDFDEILGENELVNTFPHDDIFYAIRKGRFGHTRFVRNRNTESCHHLSIFLKKNEDKTYSLLTAFVGYPAPPEPTDPTFPFSEASLEESLLFWKSHALVSWYQEYDFVTETNSIPEIYFTKK